MTTNTEIKLDEARYFFTLLQQKLPHKKEFDYLLNAFVNSARSVTWIMRSEFKHTKGWEEWFNAFAASEEQGLLLSLVNTLRVESIKRAPLRTTVSLLIDVPPGSLSDEKQEQLRNLVDKPIVVEMSDKAIPATQDSVVVGPVTVHDVRRVVKNMEPHEDIMQTCEKYLSFLEMLVKECLANFNK
jgi:hypothetical protein